MTREDLMQLGNNELIDLVLEKQAEIEALRHELEKGKKPPIDSGNFSQPPSRDPKGNLLLKRKKSSNFAPFDVIQNLFGTPSLQLAV